MHPFSHFSVHLSIYLVLPCLLLCQVVGCFSKMSAKHIPAISYVACIIFNKASQLNPFLPTKQIITNIFPFGICTLFDAWHLPSDW